MICFSSKGNEVLKHATTWANMENIIRSERSHLQKACLHRDTAQSNGCHALEGEEMRSGCFMGTGFASGVMKC